MVFICDGALNTEPSLNGVDVKAITSLHYGTLVMCNSVCSMVAVAAAYQQTIRDRRSVIKLTVSSWLLTYSFENRVKQAKFGTREKLLMFVMVVI
jgi:hypothetical protein